MINYEAFDKSASLVEGFARSLFEIKKAFDQKPYEVALQYIVIFAVSFIFMTFFAGSGLFFVTLLAGNSLLLSVSLRP